MSSYDPTQNISVTEAMMAFKGRSTLKILIVHAEETCEKSMNKVRQQKMDMLANLVCTQ